MGSNKRPSYQKYSLLLWTTAPAHELKKTVVCIHVAVVANVIGEMLLKRYNDGDGETVGWILAEELV